MRYKEGQRIKIKGQTGTIHQIDNNTGAIRAIAWDGGNIQYFRYLNPKQQEFLQMQQKDKTLIAGRGFGKTRVIGNKLIDRASHLPRAKGFLSSSTYGQILTKTVPEILSAWNELGYKEWKSIKEPGHFVVGKKPPSQWETPYKKPEKYSNIITFFNGFSIEFLSMDRPDLARGGTYDFGDIDEALLVDKEHIDKVLYPTLRANRMYFSHWMHQELCRYSSMPWLAKGQYLLEYKEKAQKEPKSYGWLEGTVWDNIAVLGEDYIERLRMELDPYTFALEVENKPTGKKQHGFYHAFDDDYHTYEPGYVYADNGALGAVAGMTDRVKTNILNLSFDFHGWFKCCTVYQERGDTEYMVGLFYKKENDGIDDLVDDICVEYADQKNKTVWVWGEPHGHDRTTFGGTVFDRIKARFLSKGWNCIIKAPSKMSDLHSVRYELINEAFEETNPRLPKLRINRTTCKAAIISLQNAEVTDKFQKSKADEKNKKYNQAHATHLSDTVDYYVMQKYGGHLHLRPIPGRGDARVS